MLSANTGGKAGCRCCSATGDRLGRRDGILDMNTKRCALCRPDGVRHYPTRQALWADHSFEPFLEWCQEQLAVGRWLALYEYDDGGCTEARLRDDDAIRESRALQEFIRNLKPIGSKRNKVFPGQRRLMPEEREISRKLVRVVRACR